VTGLAFVSPISGAPLAPDTPHSLAAPGERWPVVEGIPYLRVGREDLVRDVLTLLDAGCSDEALVRLLADQDDWWAGPPADEVSLSRLVRGRAELSLRDAVNLLAWGRVGDYFVHRWTDPTYLAGLALVEAHWTAPQRVFELACGIGHFLRELQNRGCAVAGGDVVFAKLWVAQNWVLARPAPLACFDAGVGWPIAGPPADLAMCHDAFYFLEPKAEILAALRRMAGPAGWLAVGHIHNRERPGFSAGSAVAAEDIETLFPDGFVYDDAELTHALVEARPPTPQPPGRLRHVEAFSVACGPGLRRPPRILDNGLTLPLPGAGLRRNPLYRSVDEKCAVAWPSERYEAEYATRATYPAQTNAPERAVSSPTVEAQARRRELVDLPERW
jgi:SAM-dependent methyltransferase